MRTIYRLNGQKIDINLPRTINDVYFPNLRNNWQDLGVVEAQVEEYPDQTWNTWTENADGTLNVTPKSLDQCKEIQYQRIAAERYQREIAGVKLPDNTEIATDRESQSKLASALLATMRDPNILIDWKATTGFVQIGKVQIEAISDAVIAHVQGCFTWEKDQCALVAAMTTVEEVIAYQWPIQPTAE